jgi:hypothetical protein
MIILIFEKIKTAYLNRKCKLNIKVFGKRKNIVTELDDIQIS